MEPLNSTRYAVVIKTDSYAGNFEREMTAYVTGEIGDCEVGSKMVPLYELDMGWEHEADRWSKKNPFWDQIDSLPDEHGCSRPCSIYNDNDKYNSFVIHFTDCPSTKQLNLIIERANMYCKDERLSKISRFISRPKKILKVFPLRIKTTVAECKPRRQSTK